MLKNVTLSAGAKLIQKAREKAQSEKTTLNESFRKWLKRYVTADTMILNFDNLMQSFNYANPGRKFTRDELNER